MPHINLEMYRFRSEIGAHLSELTQIIFAKHTYQALVVV